MDPKARAFLLLAVMFASTSVLAQANAPRIVHGTYVGNSIAISEPENDSCSKMLKTCDYPTGGQAAAFFAVDPTGNLWVSNQNSANVSKLAPNGTILGIFAVGNVPAGMLFLNGNIWVANWIDSSVSVLQASTGKLVETILLPSGSQPYQLVAADANIFVTSENGNLLEINPQNYQVKSIHIGWVPYQAVLHAGYLWVTILNGELARVNPKSGAVKFYSVPGASDITGIAAIGSHLWLLDFDSGNLIEFDPATSQVVATVTTGVEIGQTVYHNFGKVWVSGLGTDAIVRVDPATFEVEDVPIPAGYLDQPLGIVGTGKTLWVANNGPQNVGVTNFTP
jgi:streptogramin lyase